MPGGPMYAIEGVLKIKWLAVLFAVEIFYFCEEKTESGNMQNYIHILLIRFKNEISPQEIPFFRGAVLQTLHGKANVS